MDKDLELKNEFIWNKVKSKFGFDLTPGQVELVRKIALLESKRLSISAYTQYGKTFCVSIGIALLIDKGKTKVALIGPKQEQAGILRQYMADLILKDPSLLKKAMLNVEGESKITKEASRKRMTFTNGSEYRVFSAEGEAERLMGFGVGISDGIGIIVKDEACLIPKAANAKIGRMMGNNPADCILIELYNPWKRNNVTFEHTLDPKFDVVRIGWEQGVEEKRTTKEFVDDQRNELTPLEFTVLYESKFPEESEDSLYNLGKIREAEERNFGFEDELQKIEKMLSEAHKYKNSEIRNAKLEFEKYTRIVACDPADKGLDETVVYWGTKYENSYELIGYYSEPKSDNMALTGVIFDKVLTFIGKKVRGLINLDRIGIGVGPLSRLEELKRERHLSNIKIVGCHFGESAVKKKKKSDNKKALFLNKKAKNYFRNSSLFNEGLISIPKIDKLKSQLISIEWELTSSAMKKVVDPDDSPDWADALVYFTWIDKSGMAFAFV